MASHEDQVLEPEAAKAELEQEEQVLCWSLKRLKLEQEQEEQVLCKETCYR